MERHPLAPIPEVRGCFTCGPEHPDSLGMRFFYVGDRVESEWTVTEGMQGWRGLAHGSAFAMMHDDAAAYAMVILACRTGFTTRMDIRFLKPARLGERLTVTARAQEVGERRGTFASEIRNDRGDVVSTALAEFAFVDPKTLERMLGAPPSAPMAKWLAMDDDGRRAYALAWGRERQDDVARR